MTALRRTVWILLVVGAALQAQAASAATLGLFQARWEQTTVSYWIIQGKNVSDTAGQEVLNAIEEWNDAVDGIQDAPTLIPALTERSADLVIRMKQGGGNILGQTGLQFYPRSCRIKSATIQLSGSFANTAYSSAGAFNVALHELGHIYSLGHTNCNTDLMAQSGNPFTLTRLEISRGDIDGVEAVYEADECADIPVSIEIACR